MSRRAKNRGATLAAVMLAIAGLTAAIVIGFNARETQLKFQDRSRCRAAARWAAQSAVARGTSRLDRGRALGSPSGNLGVGVTYRLASTRAGAEATLIGTGECTSQGRTIRVEVIATFLRRGSVYKPARYEERPPR